MKRKNAIFITVFVIGSIAYAGGFISMMTLFFVFGSDTAWEGYYDVPQNYVEFDATIKNINIYPDSNRISIYLEYEQNYPDYFALYGENYEIAVSNGITEILTEGATVSIMAIPWSNDNRNAYIASLCHDGKEYLPFEVGYKNIAAERKQPTYKAMRANTYIKYIVLPIYLSGNIIVIVSPIVFYCVKPKKKENKQESESEQENASESKPENETVA